MFSPVNNTSNVFVNVSTSYLTFTACDWPFWSTYLKYVSKTSTAANTHQVTISHTYQHISCFLIFLKLFHFVPKRQDTSKNLPLPLKLSLPFHLTSEKALV